jgi:hypothetical protein
MVVDPQSVPKVGPGAGRYQTELHTAYLSLAHQAQGKGRKYLASFFAHKARQAVRNETISPALAARWANASPQLSRLEASRSRLVLSLAQAHGKVAERDAAQALAMFDCWLLHTERAPDLARATGCREHFRAALRRLDDTLESL